MTLLDLVNRLRIECGVSGGDLSSMSSMTRETQRLRNFVIQADLEVQELHYDWAFLRADVSFATVSHQGNYTPTALSLTNFSEWKEDSFRNYVTASGRGSEIYMGQMDYDNFRDFYLFNARLTSYSRPIVAAVGPDKALWIGPLPEDAYTVVGEYYKAPVAMSADDSTTLIPARFQMIIVYAAMMKYGAYESAQEVFTNGQRMYNAMLSSMTVSQMPTPRIGGPLA